MPPSKADSSPARPGSGSMNSFPPTTTRRSQTADTSSTVSDSSDSLGMKASSSFASAGASLARERSYPESLRSSLGQSSSQGEQPRENAIDKLLPRSIRSRRRHKKEQKEAEEAERGRRIAERGTLDDNHTIDTEESHVDIDGDALTYASDEDDS